MHVSAVIDGDTVALRDGRKLRLLGINTPELGRDGEPDDRYAREAKRALENWLPDNRQIFIKTYGKDRYHRYLAELYRSTADTEGNALSAELLAAGLAWHIVVPPSDRAQPLRNLPCLQRAEQQARAVQRGLWSQPVLHSRDARAQHSGFVMLQGRVESVSTGGSALWIDLDGDVVLQLRAQDHHWFDAQQLQRLAGQQIEVRGWMVSRRPPRPGLASLRMDLRHPAMIRVLDSKE